MAPVKPSQSGPASTDHVIIVGAGWYGLAAAKTYLELNPSVSLTIIEADSGVGGVWSRSRIYPRLVVNQPSPMFEFSDFSMSEAIGLEEWSDITGDQMAEYLEKYSEKFELLKHCRFNTEVLKIEREAITGLWKLSVRPTGQENLNVEELKCIKLIMATGHTSKPKLPENLDTSMYTGKVFHVKEIGQRYSELLKDDSVQTITVVGGNKSSFELAGMFGLEGKKVNWLIKDEGAGPGMMIVDRPDGKNHAMKGFTSRAISGLAPTPWHADRWITRALYSGKYWLCRWFITWFFKMPVKRPLEMYNKPNRRLMKPLSDSMLWISAGLAQYHCGDEAILNLIDEGKLINIQRTKIISMTGRTLKLSNGNTIESDVLIFATGWQLGYMALFDPALALDLGLQIPVDRQPREHRQHWENLEQAAEEKVFSQYPIFKDPPAYLNLDTRQPRDTTPLRHFRLMVPPVLAARHDRSIVFLGNLVVAQVTTYAEVCALWSVAYMEDMLPYGPIASLLDDRAAMEHDIAATNSYFKIRYLDLIEIPLSIFEIREVIDQILLDLGLRADRHGMKASNAWFGWKAWMAEWFTPYEPKDYRGFIGEFRERIKKR